MGNSKKPFPRGTPVGGMSKGQGGSRLRRGKGGLAQAKSDEGFADPKDRLYKEREAFLFSNGGTVKKQYNVIAGSEATWQSP